MSESQPGTGARGGDVRSRLQAALRAAMKTRDTVAVSALRSALAAARQYQTAGHADRADRLLREAQAIRSALEDIGHA
jgi:uncharacterized protein YqeY